MPRQQINIKLPPELIEVLRETASAEEITLTELIQRFCEQGLGLPPSIHQAVDTESIYERILGQLDERISMQLDKRIPDTQELLLSQVELRISTIVYNRIAVLEEQLAVRIEDADKLATVSAFAEAITVLDESAESAVSSASESAIVEDVIALNPIEEVAPVEVEEDVIAFRPKALHLWYLAKRLRVKEKTLLRLRDEPNFRDWTKQNDPDGFAWGYFSDEEPPYRVLAQDTTEGTAPVVFEQDKIASDSEDVLELTEKSATTVALSEVEIASNSENILEPATAASELAEVIDEVESTTSAAPTSHPHSQEGITAIALGERLKRDCSVIGRTLKKGKEKFKSWSRKLDPDGIAWVSGPGEGRSPVLYYPCPE